MSFQQKKIKHLSYFYGVVGKEISENKLFS